MLTPSLLTPTETTRSQSLAHAAAAGIRCRSNGTLARPYICRLSIFSLFTCPSVWPLLYGSRIAASMET